MPYTLGKPGCPICKGKGVYDSAPLTKIGFDGVERTYPTVTRCSCLEAKTGETARKPDAQSRAAGEKAD